MNYLNYLNILFISNGSNDLSLNEDKIVKTDLNLQLFREIK